MVGWRMKFVFLLVIYFAGFATAVYFIAPTPREGRASPLRKDRLGGSVDSRELACAMNAGMHKAADLSKELAIRASVLIRERVKEFQASEKQGIGKK